MRFLVFLRVALPLVLLVFISLVGLDLEKAEQNFYQLLPVFPFIVIAVLAWAWFEVHMRRHRRDFGEIEKCRQRLISEIYAAGRIESEAEYKKKYNLFTEIRIATVEAMKVAGFSPENYGRMEFLGVIERQPGLDGHIKGMCAKALAEIEKAVADEKHSSIKR